MQTFLPSRSFAISAIALDKARLGKQRVEAYQILRALEGKSKGWTNHPATKMWRGYERALRNYLRAMIEEWISRGYKNTMEIPPHDPDAPMPPWLGDPALHASHRANLRRKDPKHYAYIEDPAMPYYWPTEQEKYNAASV
jgi:hypothetical protein